nr:MAG TPA: hypothetical protein [Caudoviricetes sp.]
MSYNTCLTIDILRTIYYNSLASRACNCAYRASIFYMNYYVRTS